MKNREVGIIWDATTPLNEPAIQITNVPRKVVDQMRGTFAKIQAETDNIYIVNDAPPDDPVTVTIIIKDNISALSDRTTAIIAKLVSDISWEAKKTIESAFPPKRATAGQPADTTVVQPDKVISSVPARADTASVINLIRKTPMHPMVYVVVPQLKPQQREDEEKLKENRDRKALLQQFVTELKNFMFREKSLCRVNLGGGTKQSPTLLIIHLPSDNLDLAIQLLKKFEVEYGKSFHNKFYFEFVPKGSKKEDGFDLVIKDKKTATRPS